MIMKRISRSAEELGRGVGLQSGRHSRLSIQRGEDPLGDHFVNVIPAEDRRAQGATFTPPWLIDLQLDRIATKNTPTRVVDSGAGTGRYALAAARRWPRAKIIAIEKNPVLAEAIRINALVARLKIHVICADYLTLDLPRIAGVTAFVGNPPYVRHHDISAELKKWYSATMRKLGLPDSQLAGMHIYFYLKSYLLSSPRDMGCFVTSAEWFESNYGESMRRLFCIMGGDALTRVHPGEQVFHDALTTSVVTEWTVGTHAPIKFSDLVNRGIQHQFEADYCQLIDLPKWPGYGQPLPGPPNLGPKIGDYFKVSRGQVTGCNEVWIATKETEKLIPTRFLFPCITNASDIIEAKGVIDDPSRLRRVIDLPADLSVLSSREREKVDEFLEVATLVGAAEGWIASHRNPWWRVRLAAPPAIVMSYMSRRPPAFARNQCGARLINIAHGLWPKKPISVASQNRIVAWLNQSVVQAMGRTYGGGLVKFEPGDATQIPLPADVYLPSP
jgi:adenine-specific DNA-methyltransferase